MGVTVGVGVAVAVSVGVGVGVGVAVAVGVAVQSEKDRVSCTGPKGVFTAEDKPMLEAQASNMPSHEFWSMKPLLLSIDVSVL